MICDSLQNEFWFHVAPQYEMPIAGEVPEFVDTESIKTIIKQFEKKGDINTDDIKEVIKLNVDNIDILRALIGISDKRMYLDLSYIFYKTKYGTTDATNILGENLYNVNSHPLNFFKNKIKSTDKKLASKSLEIITNYLVDGGILPVLKSLSKVGSTQAHILIDKLINAKEAQQKLTKRRGHGIEQVYAKFLYELGVEYIPNDRHLNPMSRDPNLKKKTFEIVDKKIKGKTWAFDLILINQEKILAVTQGLVHTSDPGQYGVNKSDETVTIKRELSEYNKKNSDKIELWGLVDGVGFTENKTNTIDKMLDEFDTFIQLNTLFKAALRLHNLKVIKLKGINFSNDFYTQDEAKEMFKKYGAADIDFYYNDKPKEYKKEIYGGKASVFL